MTILPGAPLGPPSPKEDDAVFLASAVRAASAAFSCVACLGADWARACLHMNKSLSVRLSGILCL